MVPVVQVVLLFLITFLILALAMVPALVEWYAKTDAEPLQVVREQDMSIRHFAVSFRSQVNAFFDEHMIKSSDPPDAFSGVWHVDEPVTFLGRSEYPEFTPDEVRARLVNRVLISSRGMVLPNDMVFEDEVYCCGILTSGDRTAFRALYSETEISLGKECVVVRWLHSDGALKVGERSQLFGRLSSDGGVIVGMGCEFERMSSPVIKFSDSGTRVPRAVSGIEREEWIPEDNIDVIDEQTWKTVVDLFIKDRSRVDKNLVAKRGLTIGEEVQILGDIKAYSSLVICPRSLIRGAIVCSGPIEIAEGCLIKGPVISESEITIGAGCVIGAPALPTTVSAPRINVSIGAQVSGTIWAARAGTVVDMGQST